MADTFSNDLRVRLQESGSNAGTWGDLLNGTITNIASALGQGSEAIPNASTHTITLADGTADEARSLYLKCTGGGQACTVTLGPNTISKVWIIDNATSYTLTFRQGSGVNVAIAAGAVKVIATDGAGSGAAVVDTLDGLEGSLKTLAVNSGATTETTAAAIGYNGDVGTNLYINTDHGNNLVSLYASGSASKEMRFLSGTLEVMRLGTTGNVGIGTGANAISHQLVSYKSGANANYVQIASGSTGLGATNGLRLGVSSAGIGEIYSQSASPVMTFNANNVGIGTSTPDTTLHLQTPSGTKSEINFAQTAVTNYRIGVPASTDALVFTYGASTERMRLTAAGDLLVGTTTQYFARFSVQGETFQNAVTVRVGTNGYPAINFQNTAGAQQGYIVTNASSVQYVSISDERAKENIADADDAGSKIDSIQVRKFDWIVDGSHQDYGMIAQELQAVAPEAVSGDADSENMMGVDYSKLVPMLVKEIKSLRTRVQTLENN